MCAFIGATPYRPARLIERGYPLCTQLSKTGGKQYSVKVGDVVYVEKLNAEDNSEVTFDQVLAVGEEGSVKVGAPVVEGASVVAKVVKTGKGKKLNILTYRPKKGSMVRKGHRQPYTKVEITAING